MKRAAQLRRDRLRIAKSNRVAMNANRLAIASPFPPHHWQVDSIERLERRIDSRLTAFLGSSQSLALQLISPSAAGPQPKLGLSPAKAQRLQRNKIDFRTWRTWRLGARNIRIREFLKARNLREPRKFSSIVVRDVISSHET